MATRKPRTPKPPKPPKREQRGRPLLLSEKTKGELIQAIQVGATYEMACGYAGVSYSSFHRWFERGRVEFERRAKVRDEILELLAQGKKVPKKLGRSYRTLPTEKVFLEFWKQITEANMVAGVGWLQVIDTVAQQNPEWSSFMLAKRFPNEFGKAAKQEVEVKTEPVQVQHQHHHEGEVKVKTEPNIDRIAEILGILSDAGAFEAAAETPASGADGSADAETQ